MARADMPYPMEKNDERSTNEILKDSTEWESKLYTNVLQSNHPSTMTSSVRNGCLPSSRLPDDGYLSPYQMGKTPSPYLSETLLVQQNSPEPEFDPPRQKTLIQTHVIHPKPKDPPPPNTIRLANPGRKTVPTLAPKVRDPPPPIVVRQSNPEVKTIPTLLPKIKEQTVIVQTSPESNFSSSSPKYRGASVSSKSQKRGRRRKRGSQEDSRSVSPVNLHYTVEPDEKKPFTFRLKLNKPTDTTAPNVSTETVEGSSSKALKFANKGNNCDPNQRKSSEKTRSKSAEVFKATSNQNKELFLTGKTKTRTENNERKEKKPLHLHFTEESEDIRASCCSNLGATKEVNSSNLAKLKIPELFRTVQIKDPVTPPLDLSSINEKTDLCVANNYAVKEQGFQVKNNSDLSYKVKGRRKKANKSSETFISETPVVRETEKEKLPEISKGPKIKTLKEILDSLNIKLDNKFDDRPRSQTGQKESIYSTNNVGNNTPRSTDRYTRTEHSRKRSKSQVSNDGESSSNDNQTNETSLMERRVSCKEECSDDSSKRIKIILSGEVSRRPKKILNSSASASSNAASNPTSPKSAENSEDEYQNDDTDSDSSGHKMQKERHKILKQEKKKKQRALAKKHEAKDRKELKDILQARSAYRRELPADGFSNEVSNDQQNKYRGLITPSLSKSGLTKVRSRFSAEGSRPLGMTSPRDDVKDRQVVKEGEGLVEQSEKSFSSIEESSEQSTVESIVEKSVEESVQQLIKDAESDILESHGNISLLMSGAELESAAEKLSLECIEGVTGNYSQERSNSTIFREWHEATIKTTAGGDSLVLLPYCVID